MCYLSLHSFLSIKMEWSIISIRFFSEWNGLLFIRGDDRTFKRMHSCFVLLMKDYFYFCTIIFFLIFHLAYFLTFIYYFFLKYLYFSVFLHLYCFSISSFYYFLSFLLYFFLKSSFFLTLCYIILPFSVFLLLKLPSYFHFLTLSNVSYWGGSIHSFVTFMFLLVEVYRRTSLMRS